MGHFPPLDAYSRDAVSHRLGTLLTLSEDERQMIRRMQTESRQITPLTDIIEEGQCYERLFILKDGWAIRYKLLADGRRQILSFALPGDFIGIRAALFETSDHSVQTLTHASVYSFPVESLMELCEFSPKLALTLIWSNAREKAMLAEHITRLGRRSAYEGLAHLLLELLNRLQYVGLASEQSYEMPLTQEVLADALGLTPVHINRTLRRLREDGLVEMNPHSRKITINDVEALSMAAGFEPAYLDQDRIPVQTVADVVR